MEEGMTRYKVWECKIAVPADAVLPEGFDFPPRRAAMEAVDAAGIPVLYCFSGWGGSRTEGQAEVAERFDRKRSAR